MSSILWFSRAFLLQSKNPNISACINTKCLLTYSQKFTQTRPLVFIQENLSISSQPVSQRQPHPHLSQQWSHHGHTFHTQHLRSPSCQSFGWWLTFISHAYQTGCRQRPRGTAILSPARAAPGCVPEQSREAVFPGSPLVLLLSNACFENHAGNVHTFHWQ